MGLVLLIEIRSSDVVDDTVEQRFGKKMPGISSHHRTTHDGPASADIGLEL
jgi:hypothetical protein